MATIGSQPNIPLPTEDDLSDFEHWQGYQEKVHDACDGDVPPEIQNIFDQSFKVPTRDEFMAQAGLLQTLPEQFSYSSSGTTGFFAPSQNYTNKICTKTSDDVEVAVCKPEETSAASFTAETPHTRFYSPKEAHAYMQSFLSDTYEQATDALSSLQAPCVQGQWEFPDVSTLTMGALACFIQGRIQSPDVAQKNLTAVTQEYCGLDANTASTTAQALYHMFDSALTSAYGQNYTQSKEFQSFISQFKAQGGRSSNTFGKQPFESIQPAVYDFIAQALQNPAAYEELNRVEDSATYEVMSDGIDARLSDIKQARQTLRDLDSPDELYDIVQLYSGYAPAKGFILGELGVSEQQIAQAEAELGRGHLERDSYDPTERVWVTDDPIKPNDIDDKTWNLALSLARRKQQLDIAGTLKSVATFGASIAAFVVVGAISGNPVLAGLASAGMAAAVGSSAVNDADADLHLGRASQTAEQFTNVPLGSGRYVSYLDQKKSYAIDATLFNTLTSGLVGGTSTAVMAGIAKEAVPLTAGAVLKRMGLQSLFGMLDGFSATVGNPAMTDQGFLTRGTELAGGDAKDAPTVVGLIFQATLIGGMIGGASEGVMSGLHIMLSPSSRTLTFRDEAGATVKIASAEKVGDGLYRITTDDGASGVFRVDEGNVGVVMEGGETPALPKQSPPEKVGEVAVETAKAPARAKVPEKPKIKWPTPREDSTGDIVPLKPHLTGDISSQWRTLDRSPFTAVNSADGTVINGGGKKINLQRLNTAIEDGFLPGTSILNRSQIEEILQAKIAKIELDLTKPNLSSEDIRTLNGAKFGLKKFLEELGPDTMLIEGIVPHECLKAKVAPFTPQEIRAMRLRRLQRDPAHNYEIGGKSAREGEIGLELEELGVLPGPIERELTGRAEFVDAEGRFWDIKKPFTEAAGSQGAFELDKTITLISGEIRSNKLVILDTVEMSLADLSKLREAIEANGWSDKVIWYPPGALSTLE